MPNTGRCQLPGDNVDPNPPKALWMNSGKKFLILRRASSRKTPEMASAAERGARAV